MAQFVRLLRFSASSSIPTAMNMYLGSPNHVAQNCNHDTSIIYNAGIPQFFGD